MRATEKEQTTIRLPAEELNLYVKEAYEKGYSLNAYLIMLIRKGRQH